MTLSVANVQPAAALQTASVGSAGSVAATGPVNTPVSVPPGSAPVPQDGVDRIPHADVVLKDVLVHASQRLTGPPAPLRMPQAQLALAQHRDFGSPFPGLAAGLGGPGAEGAKPGAQPTAGPALSSAAADAPAIGPPAGPPAPSAAPPGAGHPPAAPPAAGQPAAQAQPLPQSPAAAHVPASPPVNPNPPPPPNVALARQQRQRERWRPRDPQDKRDRTDPDVPDTRERDRAR
jgi:hypothetical protein